MKNIFVMAMNRIRQALLRTIAVLITLCGIGVGDMWGWDWPANRTIYFNIQECPDFGTPYFRIGRDGDNKWCSKYEMTLVQGTKYLYSYTKTGSAWEGYGAFAIAHKYGWVDRNTIYQPYTDQLNNAGYIDDNKITKQTDFQKYAVDSDPYLKITGTGNTDNQCQYYHVNEVTSGDGSLQNLPSYSITYSAPSNGTLTVTQYNGSTYDACPSNTSVNPTQIIKIATSPSSGYELSTLTVTGATQIEGGETYYVTGNCTIAATFRQTFAVTINIAAGQSSWGNVNGNTTQFTLYANNEDFTNVTAAANVGIGYAFDYWEYSGITLKEDIHTFNNAIKASAAGGTLTAHFKEDLSSTWEVKGSFNSWGTGAAMQKESGNMTSGWVYATLNIDESSSATQIKILNTDGNTWYGAQNAENSLAKERYNLTVSDWTLTNTDGGQDIQLHPQVGGVYTFAWYSPNNTLQVTFPDVSQLKFYSAREGGSRTNVYDWDDASAATLTKTLNLPANTTYWFKIVYHSDYYSNTGTIEAHNCTNWTMDNQNVNCGIKTTIAGNYTFSFNTLTKQLSIEYPQNIILSCDANSWTQSTTNMALLEGTTYYYDISLADDNMQEFKIVYNSVWYGAGSENGVVLTSSDCTNKTLATNGSSNVKLATTMAATYRFLFNTDTKQVSVTNFPSPVVTAMTGTAGISKTAPSTAAKGNGSAENPYIIIKGQTFTVKGTLTSGPSAATGHIKIAFYDENDNEINQQTYNASGRSYSPSTENTTEVKHIKVKVYYEYGPDGYKVKGAPVISAIIYYKVIERPVVTLSGISDYTTGMDKSKSIPTVINVTGLTEGISIKYNVYWKRESDNYALYQKSHWTENTKSLSFTYYDPGQFYFKAAIYYGDAQYEIVSEEYTTYLYTPYQVTIFDKNDLFTHIYAWGSGDNVYNAPYPGKTKEDCATIVMEADGYKIYSFLLQYPRWKNIIISSGNGTAASNDENKLETNDLKNINNNRCVTLNGTPIYNSANYIIETSCSPTFKRIRSTIHDNTIYYSNIVRSAGDSVSFYAARVADGGNIKLEKFTNGFWQTDVTYSTNINTIQNSINSSGSNVYVTYFNGYSPVPATLTQYSGNYYLYSPAVGGSANHKASMDSTFVHFEESNSKYTTDSYNYYWVDWAKANDINDLKATIGNHINHNLAIEIGDDDLWNDATRDSIHNKQAEGKGRDSVNVRFAYNPQTNYFGRALLKGAMARNQHFLMLYDPTGNTKFRNTNVELGSEGDYVTISAKPAKIPSTGNIWCGTLIDATNWVYELDIKANGVSRVVAYSAFFGKEQYLFGADDGELDGYKRVQLLNDGVTTDLTIKLIYDFKTGVIIRAWIPDKTIEESMDLDAAMMIVRQGNSDATQISITGSKQVSKIDQIYTVLELKKSNLVAGQNSNFFISLPYDCNISDIFGIEGGYLNKWALLRYDGAARAAQGLFIDTGPFWVLVGKNETLQKGTGYLLQVANLTLGDNESRRLYFPSAKGNFSMSNITAETTVEEHAYSGPTHTGTLGIDHTQSDRDWNLVGVPTYSNSNATFAPNTGISSWGTGEGMSRPAANFYYAYSDGSWTPTAASGTTFQATYSYMFQWAGTITWNSAPATAPAAIRSRAPQEATSPALIEVQLKRDDTLQDRTYVQLVDEATTGFDIGHDMTKITRSGDNIYTRCYDGELYVDLAANNLPASTTEVPLYLTTSTAGEYTFSTAEALSNKTTALYDAEENITIDLDERDYTVDLDADTYNDRFVLRISEKSDVTTAVGNLSYEGWTITQAGGQLYIGGIDGKHDIQIYTATGQLLYHSTVSAGEAVPAPQQGIYLIRIGNKTEKLRVMNK